MTAYGKASSLYSQASSTLFSRNPRINFIIQLSQNHQPKLSSFAVNKRNVLVWCKWAKIKTQESYCAWNWKLFWWRLMVRCRRLSDWCVCLCRVAFVLACLRLRVFFQPFLRNVVTFRRVDNVDIVIDFSQLLKAKLQSFADLFLELLFPMSKWKEVIRYTISLKVLSMNICINLNLKNIEKLSTWIDAICGHLKMTTEWHLELLAWAKRAITIKIWEQAQLYQNEWRIQREVGWNEGFVGSTSLIDNDNPQFFRWIE